MTVGESLVIIGTVNNGNAANWLGSSLKVCSKVFEDILCGYLHSYNVPCLQQP